MTDGRAWRSVRKAHLLSDYEQTGHPSLGGAQGAGPRDMEFTRNADWKSALAPAFVSSTNRYEPC